MDAADLNTARATAIAATIGCVSAVAAEQGNTCPSPPAITAALPALASQEHLFPFAVFPPPPPGGRRASNYPLHKGDDDRFVLFLSALNPGVSSKPHNNATRAAVVAVDGQEINRLYTRKVNGLTVGHDIVAEAGRGIALLADDVHAVHTTGTHPTRHLHIYGLALERLGNELLTDQATGAATPCNRSFMTLGATAAG